MEYSVHRTVRNTSSHQQVSMLCFFLFVSFLQELRGSVLVTRTLPILGVCIRSVCLACISMTFEPTHVDYVSRHGTCFWDGWSCMCNEVCKLWKGTQSAHITLKEFKNVSVFWTAQNAKIWSFLKTTMRFICFARCCCSLLYSSFSTRTSRRWGCIYLLSSPLFSHQAPSSLFLAPTTTFAI